MKTRTPNRWRAGQKAFSLFEVMVAIGIFFMAVFAILGMISNTLRNARWIQQTTVDAAMIASQLSLTNRLYEEPDTGDFGDLYPNYEWTSDTTEVASNCLFQVDFLVQRRSGQRQVESTMSILFFRPDSPPGSLDKGFRP